MANIKDETDDETSLRNKDQDTSKNDPVSNVSCFDPRSSIHRYLILVFLCLAGFGSYFCDDNPPALQDKFEHDLNMTTTEFSVLYSVNAWPSIVLSFIGGFLVDKFFGIRLGTIIYLVVITVGQLIFAFGGMFNNLMVMMLGRMIFGFGDESLTIVLTNFAVLWFQKKELNMVFGIQLSISRLASILNFWIMESLYSMVSSHYQGSFIIGIILFLTSIACVLSTLFAVILGWLDKRAEQVFKRDLNPNDEVVKISDVKTFKLNFWIVSFICMSFYIAFFIFVALGKIFFEEIFGKSADRSNQLNSIPFTIATFACPIFGFLVDRSGKIVSWIFFAVFFVLVGNILLLFQFINPFISMSFTGIGYSIFSTAVWSLVPLIVPEYQLGTAYGMLHSIKNLGLSVVAILGGLIVDHMGYFTFQIFLIIWLILSLLATLWIWINDINSDGLLNSTSSEQHLHHENGKTKKSIENIELAAVNGKDNLACPQNGAFQKNEINSLD